MEKELIETFLTVAKVNNISKAANLLFVSQATVSYRLKLLEKKVGIPLILRSKGAKQTLLTPNGRRFLPLARTWLNTDTALENFNTHAQVLSLQVGSVNSVNNYLLKDFYSGLPRTSHTWKLTISTTHTPDIYEWVQRHKLDIGLCLEEKLAPNIHVKKIYSEPLLVVSRQPLQEGQLLSPGSLEGHKQIYINWGHSLRRWQHAHFPAEEFPLFSVDSIHMAQNLLNEDGWFFAPVCICREFRQQGLPYSIAQLGTKSPTYDLYMLTEVTNEKAKRYEIVLFKWYLQKYMHGQKRAAEAFLAALTK